jgi:hypothetical protein
MNQAKKKQPYAAPRLIVYGDVRTITRQVTRSINKDGGNNGVNSRT